MIMIMTNYDSKRQVSTGFSFVKRVDGMSLAMFFGFDGFFNVPSAMHNFD